MRADGSRIELTQSGKDFAAAILADPELYASEKALASSIKQKASEALVEDIFGMRK